MSTTQPRKGQRTSKACDACHRRKAKCYWRYPSCVDCIRLGLECTFDRSKHPQTHEANDHEQTLPVTEPEQEPDALRQSDAAEGLSTPPIQRVMNNNIEEMVVFKYFAIENHTFPIFSFAPFHHRLRLHQAGTEGANDPAWLTSLNGILAACGPHLQLADADLNEATAKKHLRTALTYAGGLVLQEPTTPATQALACVVACSRHPAFSDIPSINLLAVAIRMAFTLNLHRLDEVMGIAADDRLERIRLFWCLYILDKEMALSNDTPPLIDDDEIRLLEPKMLSEDDLGLERSLDQSKALNLFTARQRLARIGSRVWKGLHTFKARHRPKKDKLDITMQLNEDLAQWKAEWFQYGQSAAVSSTWPEKAIEKLAMLQYQYFMCLLKRNFDRPYNAIEMRDILRAGRELDHQALNVCCVLAARDTLYLTRAVRKGGLLYVFAAMAYTVPAIVMLLSHLCTTALTETQRQSDMSIVQGWLDIQEFLINRMEHPELREEYLACQDMYQMAKALN